MRVLHCFRDARSVDDVVSTCVYGTGTHEEGSSPCTSVIAPPMLALNRTVNLLRAPRSTRPWADEAQQPLGSTHGQSCSHAQITQTKSKSSSQIEGGVV